MDRTRRQVLELLGLGSLGSLAGCSFWEFESDVGTTGDSSTASAANAGGEQTPEATPETVDVEAQVDLALQDQPSTLPAYDFSYEPLDAELSDSNLFKRVQGQPAADTAGDYLQIRPAEPTATELAALLRSIWNVGGSMSIEVPVDRRDISFTGGSTAQLSTFVGTAEFDANAVLAVRGQNTEAARRLAEDAPFPLDG